ncbi:MAG: nuclear transport factor 2 family protein [Chloroflexi bacterium]|nr:nuclear transport factor 2 family protein [Chloroflexota bacterium]
MTHNALTIASTFLDAWTAGDFDTAGNLLAADSRFDGPIAHYRSAREFLEGSRPFVEMLKPGWTRITAFGNDAEALLLYDLHFRTGQSMRIADHYRVADGRIQSETILWDTHGSPFRQPAAA